MILTVPVPAEDGSEGEGLWPTLGPGVCDWIEDHLVHGPGDLRGQPAKLDDEKRFLIYRAYEVFPRDHPRAGRRRFKRVVVSLRKGTAKTEWGAWLSAAELDEEAPVRTFDWRLERGEYVPVGGPVVDPYIPMVAYTEEQSEELGYGALFVILTLAVDSGRLPADHFDIGQERIMRARGDGKAVPLATAPDSRDGARTTHQWFDESHRMNLPRLRAAHQTMLANVPKRFLADAWTLETTTAFAPGEASIAEGAMDYAKKVASGGLRDASLFYFHRQASDGHDLRTSEGLRAAVIEASGPSAAWSDIDTIMGQFQDPTADLVYLERVWLNRTVKSAGHAFDLTRWNGLATERTPQPGAVITLGFHGARYSDAAAVVACEVETGFLWLVWASEAPIRTQAKAADQPQWEVQEDDLLAAVAGAFKAFQVWRLYAAPHSWESTVSAWAGLYDTDDEDRVVSWRTNQWRRMSEACLAFANAMASGEAVHADSGVLARHIGNAHKRVLRLEPGDGDGGACWTLQKESPDSPAPFNAAAAAVLAWQARRDAVAAGEGRPRRSVYEDRGPLIMHPGGA